MTPEHFHRQFDLNVLGLLLTSQKAVESFGASGGTIINISSVAAVRPVPGGAVYSATKAAVDAITKSLAKELGARKIRVRDLTLATRWIDFSVVARRSIVRDGVHRRKAR